jgi:alginate O-acetyltransferase complex protein AlgI
VNAYAPADWQALIPVAGIAAALLLLGLCLRGGRLPWLAWLVGPPALAATHWLLLHEPPGVRMLALIAALFMWMKAVVTASNPERVGVARWLVWAMLWPGMRLPRRDGSSKVWLRGLPCIAIGAALIAGAHLLWRVSGEPWVATVPLMIGISLCLHFGLFGVLAGVWRAKPLFRNPLVSASLREFWGRRWNLAYSEMMQEAVQRPLRKRPRAALAAIFVFSGLLHEVAISLPVQAGWGLPLAYFALHGLATLVEPRVITPGTKAARVWTACWVLLPLPLLFHPPFIREIVWPLAGITAP